MQLSTYLGFDGNCREAFEFYRTHLGGEIEAMMTWGDSPMCDEVGPEMRDAIMHGCFRVGESMLMGSDAGPQHPYQGVQGASVVLTVDEPADAERIFAVLSEGGRVGMALQETFWAHRFGMATDRFGVPWIVNCGKEGWR